LPSDGWPAAELRAPLGHGPVLAGLWRSAAEGRLPHALCFQGLAGTGKFLAARWFAAGLLCAAGPGPPCLACGPCKRVRSDNHPDLFVVDAPAAGQDRITVAFVTPREGRGAGDYDGPSIGEFLSLHAREGGWRVVLVREAERAVEQAQNALLKTLEEPGRETVIVLECSSPSALLSTLRSRVVPVPLSPLDERDAERVLEELLPQASPGERAELARWSRGAPGRALTLARRSGPAMRELVLSVLSGRLLAAQAGAALWALPGEFPGKTPAAEQRSRAQSFLDVGLELLADAERAAAGVDPALLAHGAHLAPALAAGRAARRARLEAWLQARADVAWNLAAEAIVDRSLGAIVPRGTTDPQRSARTP